MSTVFKNVKKLRSTHETFLHTQRLDVDVNSRKVGIDNNNGTSQSAMSLLPRVCQLRFLLDLQLNLILLFYSSKNMKVYIVSFDYTKYFTM